MKENDKLSIMIEIRLHVTSNNISSIIYIGFIGRSKYFLSWIGFGNERNFFVSCRHVDNFNVVMVCFRGGKHIKVIIISIINWTMFHSRKKNENYVPVITLRFRIWRKAQVWHSTLPQHSYIWHYIERIA